MKIIILIILCFNSVYPHPRIHNQYSDDKRLSINDPNSYSSEQIGQRTADDSEKQLGHLFLKHHHDNVPDFSKHNGNINKQISSRHHHDIFGETYSKHHHNNIKEQIFSRRHQDSLNQPVSQRKKLAKTFHIKPLSIRVVGNKYRQHETSQEHQRALSNQKRLKGHGIKTRYEKDVAGLETVKIRAEGEKSFAVQPPVSLYDSSSKTKSNKTSVLDGAKSSKDLYWLNMILLIIAAASLSLILVLAISGCYSSTRHKKYAYSIVNSTESNANNVVYRAENDQDVSVCSNKSAVNVWRNFAYNDIGDEKLERADARNKGKLQPKKKSMSSKEEDDASLKAGSSLSSESSKSEKVQARETSLKKNFGCFSECTFESHANSRLSDKYHNHMSQPKNTANYGSLATRKVPNYFGAKPSQNNTLLV